MTGECAAPRALLVSDFDGTVTRHDFFRLAVAAFAPRGLADHWAGYRSGRLTHFEALAAIFAEVRASEEEVRRVVATAEPDPELAPLARALGEAGWDVVIASAGCAWYIEIILAAAGAGHLPVHANPGRFVEGRGLLMELPEASPYFCRATGIDKAAIVRSGLEAGRVVAFAGDGYPDAEAARLVPPELRFARADLADALRRDGLPFVPFERWSDVARALLARGRHRLTSPPGAPIMPT
jgi:2-hydroxy-3-keto-5-methylthiopentenyl-1-phosphate phosphatase